MRVDFGVEAIAGLRFFEPTKGYVGPFEEPNNELAKSHDHRLSLRKPYLEARAGLRFAGYQMDQSIRNFARAAEMADNGRCGPIAKAMFPDGITPVVAPWAHGSYPRRTRSSTGPSAAKRPAARPW